MIPSWHNETHVFKYLSLQFLLKLKFVSRFCCEVLLVGATITLFYRYFYQRLLQMFISSQAYGELPQASKINNFATIGNAS